MHVHGRMLRHMFKKSQVRVHSSLSIPEDSAKTFLQSLSGKQVEQCTEDSGMMVHDGAKMTMEDMEARSNKKHHMADIDRYCM